MCVGVCVSFYLLDNGVIDLHTINNQPIPSNDKLSDLSFDYDCIALIITLFALLWIFMDEHTN